MGKIEVYLIGSPKVYMDGTRYHFPFRRAEALFYYLVTKGSENKHVLEDMFWGDIYDEERANRNYRNAVYCLKKAFGSDIFIKNGRENLSLNPDAGVWVDIDIFLKNPSILEQADSLFYLQHFEVEHCIQFDTYVSHKRMDLTDKIYGLLKNQHHEYDGKMMEVICKKLIETDDLCEAYYYLLIEIYGKTNNDALARRTYDRLRSTLKLELGIEPERDIAETLKAVPCAPVSEEVKSGGELSANTPQEGFRRTKEEHITELMEWISLFPDPVCYEHLSYLLQMNGDEFGECVEFLVRKSKIKEMEQNQKIYYSISKKESEKNTYEKISLTRRRHMHLLAAKGMEKEFLHFHKEDLLPKLVYHFMLGGDYKKCDQYLNKYLYNFICMSNDFFPVVKDYPVHYHTGTYVNNIHQIAYIMQQLDRYVSEYQNTVNPDAFDADRVIQYTKMLLQTAVKQSDYTAAFKYLQILEEYPSESAEASRQKSYIYINKRQAGDLLALSNEALSLCEKEDMERWGFWQRMRGIALVYMGDLADAKQALMKAIDFFTEDGKRSQWDTNAAVAYSWLGEIYRLTQHYEEAGKYLNLSLKYTAKIHNISGKTLIYLRMGQCCMDRGDLKEAEKYIRASVKSFEWLGVVWNRSTAYGCAALLAAKNSQWDTALQYLKKQDTYANLIENPYEQLFYLKNIDLLGKLSNCPADVRKSLKELRQSVTPCFSVRYRELTDGLPSEYERAYLQSLQ